MGRGMGASDPEQTFAGTRATHRLYVGLLAGPSRPKIEPYQEDSPLYGGLWISGLTGTGDPAIK